MSEIKDVSLSGGVEIVKQTTGSVMVRSHISGRGEIAFVKRADFIAAIESELGVRIVPAGAVVIERSELPEVRQEAVSVAAFDGHDRLAVRSMDHDPRDVRRVGVAILAIAEYLAAHPPVDQAQVERVQGVLNSLGPNWERGDSDLAEQLVRAGVTVKDGAR